MEIERIMTTAPVIPVSTVPDIAHARPLAEALVVGGLKVIEVMLRTPVALDVIRAMAEVEGAILGAGTVMNRPALDAALSAGAEFIVSPGLTEQLGRAAIATGTPFLPGVATAGEIMRGLDLDLTRFKFFPAVASGGPIHSALKGCEALTRSCICWTADRQRHLPFDCRTTVIVRPILPTEARENRFDQRCDPHWCKRRTVRADVSIGQPLQWGAAGPVVCRG
jgi:2-dehydro-3-deoxyphosphogluconate aldolase/(4S)-4-hydroxy-2-oxoglutarate aldolase